MGSLFYRGPMKSHAVAVLSLWTMFLLGACGSDAEEGNDLEVGSDATAPDTVAETSVDTAESDDSAEPDDTTNAPDLTDAGDDTADATDGDTDPTAPPHRVGYRTGSLTYDPPDGSAARTLRVAYWYPTADTTGDEVRYLNFVPAPGVLGGAAPTGGAAPVVVFSHGNTAFAEQSVFFTEFLASHGFLVVAPDHTGNTVGQPIDVSIFHWRPSDISAVIDHLESLPADEPLSTLVSDDIAVTGHSFGGYTTLAVGGAAWAVDALLLYCQTGSIPLGGCDALIANEALYRAGFLDPRVDALVSMSPGVVGVFGASGVAQIAIPTLLVTGALDKTTTNANDGDPAWAQLSGSRDSLRLDFATAGHFTFSDACALPIAIGEDDGCGAGFIEPAQAHAAINAYALAFLRLHLLGDDSGSALLSGDERIEPDLTLSVGGDR